MINSKSRRIALLAIAAVGLLPVKAAQAQVYGAAGSPPPLYPYVAQPGQPYAVEVSPGRYVIQRPAAARPYPYVRNATAQNAAAKPASKPVSKPASKSPRQPIDHKLIQEMRDHASKAKQSENTGVPTKKTAKGQVINTTKIVREKPTVVETTRVVDDPPRVIERYTVVEDDAPPPVAKRPQAGPQVINRPDAPADGKKRVIRAEAEVTIIGPDRMSIRLFRKGDKANASAD